MLFTRYSRSVNALKARILVLGDALCFAGCPCITWCAATPLRSDLPPLLPLSTTQRDAFGLTPLCSSATSHTHVSRRRPKGTKTNDQPASIPVVSPPTKPSTRSEVPRHSRSLESDNISYSIASVAETFYVYGSNYYYSFYVADTFCEIVCAW